MAACVVSPAYLIARYSGSGVMAAGVCLQCLVCGGYSVMAYLVCRRINGVTMAQLTIVQPYGNGRDTIMTVLSMP